MYLVHLSYILMLLIALPIDVPDYPLRLFPSSGNSGRVQFYHNNTWGSLCNVTNISPTDVNVICKTIGFMQGGICSRNNTCASQVTTPSDFTSPVWLSQLSCSGEDLSSCSLMYGEHYCVGHESDVSVTCNGE